MAHPKKLPCPTDDHVELFPEKPFRKEFSTRITSQVGYWEMEDKAAELRDQKVAEFDAAAKAWAQSVECREPCSKADFHVGPTARAEIDGPNPIWKRREVAGWKITVTVQPAHAHVSCLKVAG
jgi:hypothetical protein